MPEIRFVPDNVSVQAEAGENLLEVMVSAGVYIHAACGGSGVCGKCQVKILSGAVTTGEVKASAEKKLLPGHSLACQSVIGGEDLEIEIPETSRIRKKVESEAGMSKGGRRIASAELEAFSLPADDTPPVQTHGMQLSPPSLEDNVSDLSRLLNALKSGPGVEAPEVGLPALRTLPAAARAAEWAVSASVLSEWPPRASEPGTALTQRLVRVSPGAPARNLALAIDVGTTSVWVNLVDADSGEVLGEAADYNKQISFGEDVISRIIFSTKGDGLRDLQAAAVESINTQARSIFEKTGVSPDAISFVSAAGNTTMTQLLLGVDPRSIRLAPYIPTANVYPPLDASDTGIDVSPGTPLHVFPCVSSYVGGDIVSGVAAYGLHRRPEMTLYMDVGTNGEIVVGNQDMMMTASCSAGPAFEGGGLTYGMRATVGAVESFAINPDALDEPLVLTIGRAKPVGLCGSGVITLIAELMQFGILQPNGRFNMDAPTKRLRQGEATPEYVIVWKDDAGIDADIVLTEPDIDNIVRAKAAMFSGAHTLLQQVGLGFESIERVVITGSFGNYVNLRKAVFIGLLPDLPPENFYYIRNGSLTGARFSCRSREFLLEAQRVASMMTNVELSEAPGYMDLYMAAQFLPHTDQSLFPNVMKIMENSRQQPL